MERLAQTIKVAVVQLLVGRDKQQNLARAASKVKEACEGGAQLECFNSPYGTGFFEEYAETVPGGETTTALSKMALTNRVWLVGGTIPERFQGRLHNTCTVYSPDGALVTKYQKMHLFDIDIPGKIAFRESETLSPGQTFASFSIDGLNVGLGICYDLRFPEFASILTHRLSCNVLIFPSAFNTITGPMHWHLLQRARAVDYQSYVISASPARHNESPYQAYGHSMVVEPTGDIIAEAGEGEEIIYADVRTTQIVQVRRNIPSLGQKRTDIYSLPELVQKEN